MRFHRSLILLLAAACQGGQGPLPPASEFLVAAGDSTFWIRTGKEGVTVRGAPLALARFDGRLYELYVTDDDRSYYDAVMIGQRLYRRDLITGDSSAVVEDTTVAKLAAAYARAHPTERRLEPYEEASDDPEVYATADLEIVGVHGPFLSFEHHADIGLPDGSEIHSIRRGVVDLRNGTPRAAGDLFGEREAERAVAEARTSFADGIDSLLSASGREAQEIARVLRDLRFDPTSFSVSHVGGDPAVVFLVPGEGEWAVDLAFPMSPVPVAAPVWWAEVRPMLPSSPADAVDDEWSGAGRAPTIIARYDTVEQIATLVLRDSAAQEWKAAQVPPPVDWILRLDAPPLDSASRRGLRRAFDDAALYSDETRIAERPPRAGARGAFHDVARRPHDALAATRHPRAARLSSALEPRRAPITRTTVRRRSDPSLSIPAGR
jgi:hypothetical protein